MPAPRVGRSGRPPGRPRKDMVKLEANSAAVLAKDLIPRGLCINMMCRTCRLAETNEPLQHEINTALIQGASLQSISAHAAAQGVTISAASLRHHRKEHLVDNIGEAVVRHAEITALASSLGDMQDSNIAVIMSRMVCTVLLPAIARLKADQLAKMPADQLLAMANQAAGVAGRVQSGDATTRLRELELQLKALRLDGAQRAQIAAGVDAIRGQLQANPAIWSQIEPLLQQVAAAAGEPPAPEAAVAVSP